MAGIFEILCVCVVILYLIYCYMTADFDYWTSRGISGPKPVLFFGNIAKFMMGKKCLGDVYKEIYERYPKESVVGLFFRSKPVLLLRDPKYIKQVLIKDFATFSERCTIVYDKAEPMSMNLAKLDAVKWRPLRMRLSPTFTSEKLKDMFPLLLECANYFETYLDEKVSEDGVVECWDLTSKFTIDVIGSCAFGLEMKEENEFHKMIRFSVRSNLKVVLRYILKKMPWFYKNFGHLLDDHNVTKFMTDITRNTVEYRKRNNIRRHDFIDTLIGLKDNPDKLGVNNVTDEFIAAQAFIFLTAGFETSSVTMSLAIYELAQNQSIQDKVREEIKEVLNSSDGVILYNNIKQMSFLEKIFQETLRKYPLVMFLTRKPIRNYTFEGTKINLRKA